MIRAKTITEAQYKLSQACMLGYGQFIQKGEFANEETFRAQAEPVHVLIEEPLNYFDFLTEDWSFNLSDIQKYAAELLDPVNDAPGDYSYGERIAPQFDLVLDMLRDTPATNQAIVRVSSPADIHLEHTPCLQWFQFMVYRNRLNMSVTFRSNDIGAAFIINQGGLAVLLQTAAEYAGLPVGEYHYFSPGAHLYSHSL